MFKESRLIGLTPAQQSAAARGLSTKTPSPAIGSGATVSTNAAPSALAVQASARGVNTPVPTTNISNSATHSSPLLQDRGTPVTGVSNVASPQTPTAFGHISVTDATTGAVSSRPMTAAEEMAHYGSISPLNQAAIDSGAQAAPTQDDINKAAQDKSAFGSTNNPTLSTPSGRKSQVDNANDLTGKGGKGLMGSALTSHQLTTLPSMRDAAIAQDKANGGDGYAISQQYANQESTLKAQLAQQQQQEKQAQVDFQTKQQSGAGAGTTAPTSNAIAGTGAQMQAEAAQRAQARTLLNQGKANIGPSENLSLPGTTPPATVPPPPTAGVGTTALPSATPNGAPPAQTNPDGTTVPPAGTIPPTTIPPADTTPPAINTPPPAGAGTPDTTTPTDSMFPADMAANITKMLGVVGLQNAQTQVADLKQQMAQGKLDQQTGNNQIEQVKDDTIAAANTEYSRQLDYNNNQDMLNRNAVENAKIDSLDIVHKEQAQADLASHIAYHNQEVQNTQTEMFNRRSAAREGLEYSTSGLQYLQTEQQKGIDALTNISQQIAVNDAGFAMDSAKIYRDYTQNTLQASQQAMQASNTAWKNHQDAISNAKANAASQEISLRQFTMTTNEKLNTDLNTIDNQHTTIVKDLVGQMTTQHTAALNLAATTNYRNAMLGLRGQALDLANSKFDFAQYSQIKNKSQDQKKDIQHTLDTNPVIKDFETYVTKQSQTDSIISSLTKGGSLDPASATALQDLFSRAFTTGSRVPSALVHMLDKNESPLQHFEGLLNTWQGKGGLPDDVAQQMQIAVNEAGKTLQENALSSAQNILMRINGNNRLIPDMYGDTKLRTSDFTVPGLTLPTDDTNNYLQGSGNGWAAPAGWKAPEKKADGTGGEVTATPALQSFRSEIGNLGTVTQDFTTPVNYTKSGTHGAIDIAMSQGSNVPAFVAGKVIAPMESKDFGNNIVVQDAKGYKHIYAHLSNTNLKEGDSVNAGTLIGLAGHTGHTDRDIESGGKHTGDHLHYQINDPSGKPIDPYSYYGDQQPQYAQSQPDQSQIIADLLSDDPLSN